MTATTDPVAGELVLAPQPMLPMSIGAAADAMTQYQRLTAELLTADDWQGIPGRDQSFVKRRGWAKLATFYGVSTELRSVDIDRDDQGQPVRVRVIARATHPNGRYAEGDGACSTDEARFGNPKGRGHLEHDLHATATTRAVNRAISNLIGFGEVSAEEVGPPGAADTTPAAPHGPVTDDHRTLQDAANSIKIIAGQTPVDAEQFILLMGQKFDGVPVACITMLRGLARYVSDARASHDADQNGEVES